MSGGLAGYFFGQSTACLKPLGDIFLNLIFTILVPLIFFNVSSAISRSGSKKRLGKLFGSMACVFIFTGVIAGILALVFVQFFPPAKGIYLALPASNSSSQIGFLEQLASIFTVTDFSKLFSPEHMLALIVFSIFVGLAVSAQQEKHKTMILFLHAGESVCMRIFSLIMYYAPIGFFAYFANLVHELGPELLGSYLRVAVIYYVFAFFYFTVVYTGYAYLAGNKAGILLFWNRVLLPMLTSIATCSSAASIPANLKAAKAMRIAPEIYETTVPLGAIIHKDGSVIGGMIKIAFLFGLFHMDFSGSSVLLTALGVSLLVGTVMGAIPSGGMLGELLILSLYGFPPSALMVIAAISIIIDPVATMLNVTGNTVSCMMIARLVDGKKWLTGEHQKPEIIPVRHVERSETSPNMAKT